jgi:hypothetical protein
MSCSCSPTVMTDWRSMSRTRASRSGCPDPDPDMVIKGQALSAWRQQGARRPSDIISYRRARSPRNQRATSSETPFSSTSRLKPSPGLGADCCAANRMRSQSRLPRYSGSPLWRRGTVRGPSPINPLPPISASIRREHVAVIGDQKLRATSNSCSTVQ